MRRLGAISLSLSLLLGAAYSQTIANKTNRTELQELEKVSGVWVQAGDNLPPEEANARLIYQGSQFEGRLGNKVLFSGKVDLHPIESPKQLDMTFDSGPNKGKTMLGVYELDANNYRGCLSAPGKPRPKTLTPEPGSDQQGFAFRRVNESAKVNEAPDTELKRREPANTTAASGAELKRLEGTWSYLSVVVNGKPVPEDALKENRLILNGSAFTIKSPQGTMHGAYAVDPTAQPKTIEVTFSDGPRAGKSIKGIYELTEDTCTVCLAPENQPPPTGFDSKAGTGHTLEMMRRTKP